MALSLFNHDQLAHYRTRKVQSGQYDHSFGGKCAELGFSFVNVANPFHLIYGLDTRDPAIPVRPKGNAYLPLIYGFNFAEFNGDFVYRIHPRGEIEIVLPRALQYDPSFPYEGYPSAFPKQAIALEQIPHDPTCAEDVVPLQGVFDVNGLSESEMRRAIKIAIASGSYDPEDGYPEWTDEQTFRLLGRGPFAQGSPSKSCDNPDCNSPVRYRSEEVVVREESLHVIGIYKPEKGDTTVWGSVDIEIIFQHCRVCGCIDVCNRCS